MTAVEHWSRESSREQSSYGPAQWEASRYSDAQGQQAAPGYDEAPGYPAPGGYDAPGYAGGGYGDAQGYADGGGYPAGYTDTPGYAPSPGYADPQGYAEAPGYPAAPGYAPAPGYAEPAGYAATPGYAEPPPYLDGAPAQPDRWNGPVETDPWGAPAAPGGWTPQDVPAGGDLDDDEFDGRRPSRLARAVRDDRSPAPKDGRTGNRLLLLILFWSGLSTSIALWWFGNPPNSIVTIADSWTAAGRITGMAAGYVMVVQFILISRVAWLEDWVGSHDLLIWHRQVGAYLVAAVVAHAGATTMGYAYAEQITFTAEVVKLFNSGPDMVNAFLAAGLLIAIGLLAVRTLRRSLPFELWKLMHQATWAVAILGYGHQVALGADLQSVWSLRFWEALYLLAIACLVWGRIVEPLLLNQRHKLRVEQVVQESDSMFSIYVTGRKLEKLQAEGGQYFRWRFMTKGCWWQSHPFSLSAAPDNGYLRLTVSAVGKYTERLSQLRPGTKVFVGGPYGTFTADRRTRPAALLIAGGSGIAPIRAVAEDMPADTVLIYRASDSEDLVFADELQELASQRGIAVSYVVGSRNDPGPRRLFTAEGMRELLPDIRRRDVYLCGPPGLVNSSVALLRELKVPRRQIHLDPFEF